MSGKTRANIRQPLFFSEIEDLRRKGFNQSEIAEQYGVTRQAVSWQKQTYGGFLTPRQIVRKSWPWKTSHAHSKVKPIQRLRDHGEFMATGGKGMSAEKLHSLELWWKKLREEDVVLEFDPAIPPIQGVSPAGCLAYRPRVPADGELLIRVNEHTNLTEEGELIWCWPPEHFD